MNTEILGDYIRKAKEALNLPLRKVTACLDIDTSTLSKVERNERPSSPSSLKPLAEILNLYLKEVQTKFIAEKIDKDFTGMEHLTEGLQATHQNQKKPKQ